MRTIEKNIFFFDWFIKYYPIGLENINPNSELVRKILRLLSKTWKANVTAIQEVNDRNTLSLEELLGSLIIY